MKQLTKKQMGNKLGLDTSRVTLIESGKIDVTVNTVLDIANILEVKPTELFNFSINLNLSANFT